MKGCYRFIPAALCLFALLASDARAQKAVKAAPTPLTAELLDRFLQGAAAESAELKNLQANAAELPAKHQRCTTQLAGKDAEYARLMDAYAATMKSVATNPQAYGAAQKRLQEYAEQKCGPARADDAAFGAAAARKGEEIAKITAQQYQDLKERLRSYYCTKKTAPEDLKEFYPAEELSVLTARAKEIAVAVGTDVLASTACM